MNKEDSKTPISRIGDRRPFAPEPISRRSFIKRSAVLGASSIVAGSAVGWMPQLAFAEAKADIAAVKGTDNFQNTIKAVELLGGMDKFVSKQSKLIRPQKVIAGTDRVAMDVYGANLLGLEGEEILTTQKAYEFGMGEFHLSSLQIQEVKL